MGETVVLLELPGFDGNNVNIENDPLYEAISKRVDLILFVHSSVSAFNVTSAKYLDKLREYNESVPVYLIHNVFDSSYWRDEEGRRLDVERQAQKEYDEIRRKGFSLVLKRQAFFPLMPSNPSITPISMVTAYS